MAGKTKGQEGDGHRPTTPKTPKSPKTSRGMLDGPLKGHLGLKSSPFAPTSSKLTSQYMVLDHMNAHYRKVHSAKAAVDCSPPKAWSVSQKVRDRARREAVKQDVKRQSVLKKNLLTAARQYNDSLASSDADRDEMFAMLRSYQDLPEAGPDEIDGFRGRNPNSTLEAHASSNSTFKPDANDIKLVNKMISDSQSSPSKYHTEKQIRSNIPSQRGHSAKSRTPRGTSPRAGGHHGHYSNQPVTNGHLENHYDDHAYGEPNGYTNGYLHPHSAGTVVIQKSLTPRSADLLDIHGDKFTHPEKPFEPRTLSNSKYSNVPSRLSEFKYYNAPKKRTEDDVTARNGDTVDNKQKTSKERRDSFESRAGMSMTKSLKQSRPETPYSEVDWMNETIMSRASVNETPSGVPPLNISLDADHMKWLKEQTKKAQVRSTVKARSEAGEDLGSTWGSMRSQRAMKTRDLSDTRGLSDSHKFRNRPSGDTMQGTHTYGTAERQETGNTYGTNTYGTPGRNNFTLSGSIKSTGYFPKSSRSVRIEREEEELKYLEFISDVTNDVLDRNIFTNRVLKQVFESHIQKRKHELKVSKMREMLDDLRIDLGIPEVDDEDSLGLTSTLDLTVDDSAANAARAARRKGHPSASQQMPNLKSTKSTLRSGSPDAKPPLPRPGSRGSKSRPGSASSLRGSGELKTTGDYDYLHGTGESYDHTGSSSTFGNITALPPGEEPNILTINHEEDNMDGTLTMTMGADTLKSGVDENDQSTSVFESSNDNTKDQDQVDEVDGAPDEPQVASEPVAAESDDVKEPDNEEHSDHEAEAENEESEYEMPPKNKMVDDMTLTYQYALEDTLDNEGVASQSEDEEKEAVAAPTETNGLLDTIPEVDTPKERSSARRRHSQRSRNSVTPRDTTPRSATRTNTTSESVEVSELDEDDEDF